ncbi:ATP-binding protein [Streptomyces sp. SudanB182_2057]|uniref:ATP-binding protein n=1 Tax=Streptomyces sp. SudanB182_2057 TaxID=3035281 RepID=UPI003F549487
MERSGSHATEVDVELRRSSMKAITDVVVTDKGHGVTPERARTAFHAYGTTWKRRAHTEGGQRILHGRNGAGRLFAFALRPTDLGVGGRGRSIGHIRELGVV